MQTVEDTLDGESPNASNKTGLSLLEIMKGEVSVWQALMLKRKCG